MLLQGFLNLSLIVGCFVSLPPSLPSIGLLGIGFERQLFPGSKAFDLVNPFSAHQYRHGGVDDVYAHFQRWPLSNRYTCCADFLPCPSSVIDILRCFSPGVEPGDVDKLWTADVVWAAVILNARDIV